MLFTLRELIELSAARNEFTNAAGALSDFGGMSELRVLDLSSNKLNGLVAEEIMMLPNLQCVSRCVCLCAPLLMWQRGEWAVVCLFLYACLGVCRGWGVPLVPVSTACCTAVVVWLSRVARP